MGGSVDDNGTVSIELPAALIAGLEKESRRRRKSLARMLAEHLEDLEDARVAAAVLKRIKSGEEKTIPAEEVYKRLGLA